MRRADFGQVEAWVLAAGFRRLLPSGPVSSQTSPYTPNTLQLQPVLVRVQGVKLDAPLKPESKTLLQTPKLLGFPGAGLKESIMEFFKEHAVQGKTDTEIVKAQTLPAPKPRGSLRLQKDPQAP